MARSRSYFFLSSDVAQQQITLKLSCLSFQSMKARKQNRRDHSDDLRELADRALKNAE
jgi:hypothetical protein